MSKLDVEGLIGEVAANGSLGGAIAATIRAHIEELEARVRALEAVAGYAEHRVDCRHATYAAEACDCGLDAAIATTEQDHD